MPLRTTLRYLREARITSEIVAIAGAAERSQRRVLYAGLVVMGVVLVGTTGYHTLGQGQWSWMDCLYMTVITLSTVGFAETLGEMGSVPGARVWTLGLIVFGSGSLLYFASMLTAFVVEGDLRGAIRRNRMQNQINNLSNHVILCGIGETGFHVAAELVAARTPFVVVELDPNRVADAEEEIGTAIPHIIGDATEDEVLRDAGIERARGIVAVLHDDPQNLFVTLTARSLHPALRIVAKAIDPDAERKMILAGADSVVLPHSIGANRLVSEMISPEVVAFIDQMMRDHEEPLRFTELPIQAGSTFVGKRLRDSQLRQRANALVLALRYPDGSFQYNPDPDTVLEEGTTLIVLCAVDKLSLLQ